MTIGPLLLRYPALSSSSRPHSLRHSGARYARTRNPIWFLVFLLSLFSSSRPHSLRHSGARYARTRNPIWFLVFLLSLFSSSPPLSPRHPGPTPFVIPGRATREPGIPFGFLFSFSRFSRHPSPLSSSSPPLSPRHPGARQRFGVVVNPGSSVPLPKKPRFRPQPTL
jgi:hypothetical protein